MKNIKRHLRKIIRESEESEQSRGDRLVSHMVDALVAYLRSDDMLLSTDEVADWLLGEFKLSRPGSPVPHGLIDRVLNDVRLDDLYEPRDDAWGESEVPYAGPGDDSVFNEGKTMKVTKRQLKRIIKEEKRKLLNETVADMKHVQDLIDSVSFKFADSTAQKFADQFTEDMKGMFIESPEIFSQSQDEWHEEVEYAAEIVYDDLAAKLEGAIKTAIKPIVEYVVEDLETKLHNGEFGGY